MHRLCVGLTLLLIGISARPCHSESGKPIDYANAYKALMVEFRDTMKRLSVRPLPLKSASKNQKRADLAGHSDDISKEMTATANKLNALKPPTEFQEVHTTTLTLIRTYATDLHLLAWAERHGNREARTHVMKDNDARERKATLRWEEAVRRVRATVKKLQSATGGTR
jgi:hypothetical protein